MSAATAVFDPQLMAIAMTRHAARFNFRTGGRDSNELDMTSPASMSEFLRLGAPPPPRAQALGVQV
jgi:hypothetical protein